MCPAAPSPGSNQLTRESVWECWMRSQPHGELQLGSPGMPTIALINAQLSRRVGVLNVIGDTRRATYRYDAVDEAGRVATSVLGHDLPPELEDATPDRWGRMKAAAVLDRWRLLPFPDLTQAAAAAFSTANGRFPPPLVQQRGVPTHRPRAVKGDHRGDCNRHNCHICPFWRLQSPSWMKMQ